MKITKALITMSVVLSYLGNALAEQRLSLSFPLPRLIVRFSTNSHIVEEVFISYGQSMEGYAVGDFDDRYVHITPRKRTDFFHREEKQFAYLLTDFEAQQIDRVCNGFIRALEILERNLQAQRFNRCLLLDRSLLPFLYGFYYLISAARCSRNTLPFSTCIPDSLLVDSLQSQKRVTMWFSDPERTTKLRISIKELIYQIRQWQKDELDNPGRDKWTPQSGKFEKAYELFVTSYLGRIF